MSRATPQMWTLARRLIEGESSQSGPSDQAPRPAGFLVCEKLSPQLATLMGRTGSRALLSRALALSTKDVSWLRAVLLTETGILEVSEGELKNAGAKEVADGSSVLVAELLGLLVAFIGNNLTLGLIRDIWPDLSLGDSDFI